MYYTCMALIDLAKEQKQRLHRARNRLVQSPLTTEAAHRTSSTGETIKTARCQSQSGRIVNIVDSVLLLLANAFAVSTTIDHIQLLIAAVSFVGSFWQRHSPTPKHRQIRTPYAWTVAA